MGKGHTYGKDSGAGDTRGAAERVADDGAGALAGREREARA